MSHTWTRAVRFIAREDGKTYYGDVQQPGDIGLLAHSGALLTARVLSGSPLLPSTVPTSRTLTIAKLLSPLAPSEITAIRGLGLQYPFPGSDAKPVAPAVPCLFFKPATSIAGPGDEILIPECARGEKNDYEVELCAVLGADCPPNVAEDDAIKYVAGYCVVNDVSSRGLCAKAGGGQWGMGKAYDTWCPIGPALIHPSALGKDPHSLRISTHINGKLAQEGTTRDLIVKLPKLIADLSRGATLAAGSLILTGSPIAVARKAPGDVAAASPFMTDGDEVRCWVEGCGTLINTVRDEKPMTRVYKAKL
ncbi:hypothetical protein JCM5296_000740 [Sporobolomyces johnsonii]